MSSRKRHYFFLNFYFQFSFFAYGLWILDFSYFVTANNLHAAGSFNVGNENCVKFKGFLGYLTQFYRKKI